MDRWGTGGPGYRQGRRDPVNLQAGDCIDSWRVEGFEPNRRLVLRSEMKLPGQAWLEFEVIEAKNGYLLRQSSTFHPSGWAGRVYWKALLPFHKVVYRRLLNGIGKQAQTGPP